MFQPSPRSGKKIVIIAVGAVLLTGLVFGGIKFGPRVFGKRGEAAQADAAQGKSSGATDAHKGKNPAKEGKKGQTEGISGVVALGDFLVNLQSSGAMHYLRTERTRRR